MTPLEELKARNDAFINVEDAAKVIGTSGQSIRCAVRHNPMALNFPVVVLGAKGKNIKIPRLPFINLVESGSEWFNARNNVLNNKERGNDDET